MATATTEKTETVTNGASAESTALQVAPASAPPSTQKVPVHMGLAPKTLDEAWRMAQFMSGSEIVPKQYRNKPADVLVAIQYGMELGFPPMQALQSIAVINGRPGVFGDGFLALITSSSLCREHDEYYEVEGQRRDGLTVEDLKRDDSTAVCTFWRAGRQQPITRRFSIGQAKKAGLLGKEGPWSNYPDRMLMMRARGFAGRDGFADLLRGVRTAEELRDTPDDDPIDIPTRPEPVQPRRASEARATSSQSPATAPASTPAPQSAAAPGNAPSTPASAPATVSGQEMRGLLITHTSFVRPKTGEPFYEIDAKTSTGEEKKFLTRDEQVYKEAASFESTDHFVTVGYHEGVKEQAKVLVLDRLAIYEGATPAAGESTGPLFD
jgi:hypothetical protein